MNKILLILVSLLWGNVCFSGDVYKWTDEKGNVHFTARPPAEKAQVMEVKKYGKSNATIDNDTEELKNAMINEIKKVDETEKTLNCSAALENSRWQFDTMLGQAKRNLDNGSVNQSQYAQATTELNKIKNQLSTSDCHRATGLKRSFYECMSNKNNHLMGCGSKYNFQLLDPY